MSKMSKLKKILGFPYDAKYEKGYHQYLVRKFHKPLLMVVCAILIFCGVLLITSFLFPTFFGPREYYTGVMIIHSCFFLFTIACIVLAVLSRRRMYMRPNPYTSNIYAAGICVWSTTLASYANFSYVAATGMIYVSLVLAITSLFKPWEAIVVFLGNFALYLFLTNLWKTSSFDPLNIINIAFASILSIIIASAMYRFRVSSYYNNVVITDQNRQIRKINQQLAGMLHTDKLTGIYNRRYLDEKLPEKFEKMLQKNYISTMMLDVDFFKVYNDTYGHQKGDEVLKQIAKIIEHSLPKNEAYFVRYGGEEFLLLIEVHCTNEAKSIATSLCSRVEEVGILNKGVARKKITISIGYSICDQSSGFSLAEMVHRADQALYQAKDNGRNNAKLFDGDPLFLKKERLLP